MPNPRQHIFLDLPPGTVLLIRHRGFHMISNKPPEDPPAPANYELPQTYRQALIEIREMKTQIRRKQAEDIPFDQRIRLFKVWKKLVKLETEWQ